MKLGPRQLEVIKLLLQGCDEKEISRKLGMALGTVKSHFNHLYAKFGVYSGAKRVKLAVYLYENYPEWRQ